MRHARIISGAYEDAFSKEAQDNIVDAEGNVNWRAAFAADPGMTKCPACKAYYWNEAAVLECLDCKLQFGPGAKGF